MVRPLFVAGARSGRPGKKLRWLLNHARQAGCEVRHLDPGPRSPAVEADVESVLARWRESLGRPEADSFMRTAPLALPGLKRMFVAHRDGAAEAVLACAFLPASGMWYFEDLVRAPDAVNGATELLIVTALELLRTQGAPGAAFAMAADARSAGADRPACPLARLDARRRDPAARPPLPLPRDRAVRGALRPDELAAALRGVPAGDPASRRGARRRPSARAEPSETAAARARPRGRDGVRLGLEPVVERLEDSGGSPPGRWATACASSQSASHGFRGSSGPCRYVPTTRPDPAALEAARRRRSRSRRPRGRAARRPRRGSSARRGSRSRRASASRPARTRTRAGRRRSSGARRRRCAAAGRPRPGARAP